MSTESVCLISTFFPVVFFYRKSVCASLNVLRKSGARFSLTWVTVRYSRLYFVIVMVGPNLEQSNFDSAKANNRKFVVVDLFTF